MTGRIDIVECIDAYQVYSGITTQYMTAIRINHIF